MNWFILIDYYKHCNIQLSHKMRYVFKMAQDTHIIIYQFKNMIMHPF